MVCTDGQYARLGPWGDDVRERRLLVAILVIVATGGCASVVGQSTPAGSGASASETAASETAASGSSVGVLARPASTGNPLEGRNIRLVRLNDAELALQVDVVNTGTKEFIHTADWQYGFEPPLRLADLPRGTEYEVLQTDSPAGANPRTSDNLSQGFSPGVPLPVTAVYPAPPAETTHLLVRIAGMQPVMAPVEPVGAPLRDDPVLHEPRADGGAVSAIVCEVRADAEPGRSETVRIRLPSDVLFEFGSATLTPVATGAIDEAASQIGRQGGTVTVEGHTDAIDTDAFNQQLSEQRAAAVRAALEAKLPDGFAFTAVGFGETRPVAPNQLPGGGDNPDGRAQNRRVEIQLGTTTTTPSRIRPRTLATELSDRGLEAEVATVRRIAGHLLVAVTVRNPTSSPVRAEYTTGLFRGSYAAPGGITLVDVTSQRRHTMCQARDGANGNLMGSPGAGYYGPETLSVVPPGAEVVVHGIYQAPAPEVTTVDVEIGGFGAVVPSPILPG